MAGGDWVAERQAVVDTARELERLGLIAGSSGNVSVRVDGAPPRVAITPSRVPYRAMTAADVTVIDYDCESAYGELAPSSETLLHLAVYRARTDAGAVVHTHSVYVTICAVAGLDVPALVDEVAVEVGGGVRVADYAPPGTEELASNAIEALEGRAAALLANHGLVAVGVDLEAAMDVAVMVERAAQVAVMTRLLGQRRALPEAVLAAEGELYRMRLQAEGRA